MITNGLFAGQRGEIVSNRNGSVSIMLPDGVVIIDEKNITEKGVLYA